jgi:hypothetical protein
MKPQPASRPTRYSLGDQVPDPYERTVFQRCVVHHDHVTVNDTLWWAYCPERDVSERKGTTMDVYEVELEPAEPEGFAAIRSCCAGPARSG